MSDQTKRFWIASASLAGTIIGVGIFGVPFAIAQSGWFLALGYFLVLGAINLLQHLFYAEAAIACPEPLRLAGLSRRYIGRRVRPFAAVALTGGYWGALLAYIIVGGAFLHMLLSPLFGGEPLIYQLVWMGLGAAIVFFRFDVASRINFAGFVAMFAAMLAILAAAGVRVDSSLFQSLPAGDPFLAYGVILFSLSGLPAVLEMEDILKGDHRRYRQAIVIGTVGATLLTAAFGFIVWGASGPLLTDDSITGLARAIGPWVGLLGAAFGFLAVATSYVATALNLRSFFEYDVSLPRAAAWLATIGVPAALFFIGAENFVAVIAFTGAVFGGMTAVIISLLYVAVTKKHVLKDPLGVPAWVAYGTAAILAAGALAELATIAVRPG